MDAWPLQLRAKGRSVVGPSITCWLATARRSTLTRLSPASKLVFGSAIDGVRLVHLEVNEDERGSFTELFAAHWDTGVVPEQWNLVRSEAGVLRGMHLHRRHDELFCLVSGHATVGLNDLRPSSVTEGRSTLYELFAEDLAFLTFPRGVVHGWLFHRPSAHLGAVSEPYATYGVDDNDGCHWADPALGPPWPFEPRIVSDRAAAFPSLAELRETIVRSGKLT
jgi:dTDP-4-dehydrorhamnose 3,5-epimerase